MITILLLLALDDVEAAKKILGDSAREMGRSGAMSLEAASTYNGDAGARRVRVLLRKPGHARLHGTLRDGKVEFVLDGRTLTCYDSGTNEYVRYTQTRDSMNALDLGLLPALFFDGDADALLENATDVRVDRETIDKESCTRISWRSGNSERVVWIDAKRRVRRYLGRETVDRLTNEEVIDFLSYDLAPKVKDADFVFTPPKDARRSRAGDAPGLLPEGKAAPEIGARDLSGAEVRLADVRDRIVVLAFWTTENDASRFALAGLDSIRGEYKDVVFLAVNHGSDAKTVREYLEKHGLHVRALCQKDAEVSTRWYVTTYPTVYVLAKGKISGRTAEYDLDTVRMLIDRAKK